MQAVQFHLAGAIPISFAVNVEDHFAPALQEIAKALQTWSAKPTFNFQAFITAVMQLVSAIPAVIAAFTPAFDLTKLLAALPAVMQAVQALIAAIVG